MKWSTRKEVVGSMEGCETVMVLVGQEQREFVLHKKLLCDTSNFFRENVEAIQKRDSSSSAPPSSAAASPFPEDGEDDDILWLPAESADMFEIFVLWLYQRRAFHRFLDTAVQKSSQGQRRSLRFNLIRLHLFAAIIGLPALQDVAVDALQDMYLHLNWDMSPPFIAFIYGECHTEQAFRLRKWAVAMLAWTLYGSETTLALTNQFDRLFAAYPTLAEEYKKHLEKMAGSKADVRFKNPQLRLPVNKLRNGERFFGFRQCSFHSHRATVGEGTCPHLLAAMSPPPPTARSLPKMGALAAEDEVESDASDCDPIISPVGNLTEMSFLDLS
ncbi:hypothetical protein B0H63DRAFT_28572 [Podospora didyma]|uniref:BTB domain-containing protein n=1 Tax=Podospora didyma TaxID=330526 RepID=A0AAE0U7F5_9PEZI|nr:hypothetical protein B0H63DRAFT_28572 [Podospora didyma]